jgi:hypothetical protein
VTKFCNKKKTKSEKHQKKILKNKIRTGRSKTPRAWSLKRKQVAHVTFSSRQYSERTKKKDF